MTTNLKGIFIPIEILLDENLNLQEKLILSLVKIMPNSLTMSNARIGELINLSKSRVSEIVSSLVNKAYIDVKLLYKPNSKQIDERQITLKAAIKKVQEVASKIKQLGGKNKQLKQQYEDQVYIETTTKVGTQNVQQVTFGQKYYQKRPNYFCNTYSHNWDFDELDNMAEEYLDRRLEEIRNEREGITDEKSS